MSTTITSKLIEIDARGPRFSALLTTVVLAIALVTGSVWVAVFQAVVFAIGATKGPQFTPYAFIYRSLIKPRLKSPLRTEDVRPPKFAQSIGLAFALVAIVGAATGTSVVFSVAVAAALAAAFLNAAFDFCLGCQIYLLLARVRNA
ncbi:hypothetical protein GM50_17560 [freshwater metagenome]|uniref:DUF4395 domain-containing protein n=1 Tax=freshwater metagenome TaxID=449393 RepID=A0A094QLB8_9ZZZZ